VLHHPTVRGHLPDPSGPRRRPRHAGGLLPGGLPVLRLLRRGRHALARRRVLRREQAC
jgi:hypothetical protein